MGEKEGLICTGIACWVVVRVMAESIPELRVPVTVAVKAAVAAERKEKVVHDTRRCSWIERWAGVGVQRWP